MQLDDMVLVSVDDHVVEPPHLFDGRLPAKYVDLAPQFVTRDDGTNAWSTRTRRSPTSRSTRWPVGRRRSTAWSRRRSPSCGAGCYDIDERVKDMDANGVLGSLCFPSFPQFCGQLFARTEDKDVALAMVRAYNDWHIEEWCGTHPGRFIPCSLPAIWDPQVLADEVRRTAREGRPRGDVLREPVEARLAEHPLRPLGPVLGGVQRRGGRGVHAHRLVVVARDHRRPTRRSTASSRSRR